jgi:hypothetical protein
MVVSAASGAQGYCGELRPVACCGGIGLVMPVVDIPLHCVASRVVRLPPAFCNSFCLQDRIEDFPVQWFVSHLTVEQFNVALVPWTARFDEQCHHSELLSDRRKSGVPLPTNCSDDS